MWTLRRFGWGVRHSPGSAACLAVFVVTAAASLGVFAQSAEGPLARGVAAMAAGAWSEAEALFEQAVAEDPRDARAWALLGQARNCRERYSAAAEALQKALLLDPTLPGIHSDLGAALFHLGRIAEAHDELELHVKDHPGDANAHWMAGQAVFMSREVDHAIGHFRRAAELAPGRYSSLSSLFIGLAHALAGRIEEAKRAFADCERAAPDSAEGVVASAYLRRLSDAKPCETLLRPEDYLPSSADAPGARALDDSILAAGAMGFAARFEVHEDLSITWLGGRTVLTQHAFLRAVDLAAVHGLGAPGTVICSAAPGAGGADRAVLSLEAPTEGALPPSLAAYAAAGRALLGIGSETIQAKESELEGAVAAAISRHQADVDQARAAGIWADLVAQQGREQLAREARDLRHAEATSGRVRASIESASAVRKAAVRVLAALARTTAGEPGSARATERCLLDARQGWEARSPDVVSIACRVALAHEPSHREALTELGKARARLGNYESALDSLRAAQEAGTPAEELDIEIGRALWMTGSAAEAVVRLSSYTARHPESGEAWEILGLCHFARQEWEPARRCLDKASGLLARHAALQRFYLGLVAHALAQPDVARSEWQRCAAEAPRSIYGILAQGLITPLAAAGPSAGAAEVAESADRTPPREPAGAANEAELMRSAASRLSKVWSSLARIPTMKAGPAAGALAAWLDAAQVRVADPAGPAGLGLEKALGIALDESAARRSLVASPEAMGLLEEALRQAEGDRSSADEERQTAMLQGQGSGTHDLELLSAQASLRILQEMQRLLAPPDHR